MEMLEDKIKNFLVVDVGYGYGNGDAAGYGFGRYGLGDGFGAGSGLGVDYGYGRGSGVGKGRGDGTNYSDVADNNNNKGDSDGSGYGWGDNLGIKDVNGNIVCIIDDIPTIITSVRNNIAKGFIVKNDLQFEPCYIVKENNHFAHGFTLKDAFMSLQEKLYDDSTEEERIEAFMKQFPEYDVKYDNMDLFVYHHVLTGSCRMGREAFMSNKGLSLDGKTSVREFVKLTQDAYGGDIIKKLPEAYGIE
nr:hypothetical protein [uncultured Prevotella sp.]